MDFVYAPDGAKERRWRWAPRKMKLAETELVEELYGEHFWKWVDDVNEGSMRAAHVLVFLRLRDEIADLDYDAVDFCQADIKWDLDDDEVAASVRALEALADDEDGLDDDELAQLKAWRDRLGIKAPLPKDGPLDPSERSAVPGERLPEVPAHPGSVPIPPLPQESESAHVGAATSGPSPTT
jgi:hypothetical protein